MSDKILVEGAVLVNRYRIIKYLDQGGMQQVYLAEDISFGRVVALKVPKNNSAHKRFERSAVTSAKINHSNIAATLDYFEIDKTGYLVEEFINGKNLGVILKDDYEFFDPHLAAHFFHHLAKGLAASHHAGVFHRDLKPGNIIVSRDPSISIIKITDFGIAKMTEEEFGEFDMEKESSITGSQTIVGALPYMAPEMIVAPKSANLSADIWAVGAILYQLMTGELPFGSGLNAVPKILDAELPAGPKLTINSQFKPLNDSLWEILSACLTREPNSRPTADALVSKCSDLCYSNSPRFLGTVIDYRSYKGDWGFISPDNDLENSVFFHVDSYYGRRPEIQDRVSFSQFSGNPRNRAYPVLPMRRNF